MAEYSDLESIVARFPQATVLVVGDMMLDRYVKGQVSRISPEAPVPIVRVDSADEVNPGGAANVIANIRSLGGDIAAVGLVGQDPPGRSLLAELTDRLGVADEGLVIDDGFQTIQKTRIIAHRQQVVRVDREGACGVRPQTAERIRRAVENLAGKAQALIVSDYGKGVVDQALLQAVAGLGLPVSVDPKEKNFRHYRELGVITPNQKEAEGMSGVSIDETEESLRRAASAIFDDLRCKDLLITLGARGMALFEGDAANMALIPTQAREVFDVSGAGDTVIAVYTLAIAVGASPRQAAVIANAAAGVVVGKLGTATVSPQELRAALAKGRAG